jgi:hypothetical protein
VLAVDVATHGSFEYGRPRVLFEGRYRLGGVNVDDIRNYDVTRDGQRFLMLKPETESSMAELKVVVNWYNELQRVGASQE